MSTLERLCNIDISITHRDVCSTKIRNVNDTDLHYIKVIKCNYKHFSFQSSENKNVLSNTKQRIEVG